MWDGARERRLGRKYLKVTIIYRYILGGGGGGGVWNYYHFAGIQFCYFHL